jgi:hypothetical protein
LAVSPLWSHRSPKNSEGWLKRRLSLVFALWVSTQKISGHRAKPGAQLGAGDTILLPSPPSCAKCSTPPMPSKVSPLRSARRCACVATFRVRRPPPSSSGWCYGMCRRAGKIRRSRDMLPRPRWRSNSRTDLSLLTDHHHWLTHEIPDRSVGRSGVTQLLPAPCARRSAPCRSAARPHGAGAVRGSSVLPVCARCRRRTAR